MSYPLASLFKMIFYPGTGYAKSGAGRNSSFSITVPESCAVREDCRDESSPLLLVFYLYPYIPSTVTRCPKYFTCFSNNAHVFALNFMPAVVIRHRTSLRFLRYSSKILAITIMSPRYARQVFQCGSLSTRPISLTNVGRAIRRIYGITLNCH